MRLLLAAAALTVAATTAQAQSIDVTQRADDGQRPDYPYNMRMESNGEPSVNDYSERDQFGFRTAAGQANRAMEAPLRYRLFDWNRPDKAMGGTYFADDYFHPWPGAFALKPNRRIYRGRNGLYYCRHGDGGTGLINPDTAAALLGNTLPNGGTALLKDLPGEAIADAVKRGELRCN